MLEYKEQLLSFHNPGQWFGVSCSCTLLLSQECDRNVNGKMTLLSVLKDESKSSIEIWSKNAVLTFSSASSKKIGWGLAAYIFLTLAYVRVNRLHLNI